MKTIFLITLVIILTSSKTIIKNKELYKTTQTNITKVASTDCQCAGGNTPTYGYETIALSANNVGCIGGCGGSPFIFHDAATTVKNIRAWTGGDHNGLRALQVELFNGKVATIGRVPASGPNAEITLKAGESIVGDLELCGNGVGSRTGYIRFKTSLGQEFKVGDEHTPYYFPSGNSFLTGFFGQADSEIEHMGFYLMKPIKSASLHNIKYPTLDAYTVGLTPQIYKVNLCNDDYSTPQQQTATFQKTEGTSYSWSITLSFTFGGSISVEGGIPEVEKVTTEFHWEVGVSSTYSQTVDTSKSTTMEYPVTVPVREILLATFTWWDSKCDVPYTADLVYAFTDNSQFTFAISDIFKGAYITNVQDSYHATNLTKGQNC